MNTISKTQILKGIDRESVEAEIEACLPNVSQYIRESSRFLGLGRDGNARTVFLVTNEGILPAKMIARMAYAKRNPKHNHNGISYAYADALGELGFTIKRTGGKTFDFRQAIDPAQEREQAYYSSLHTKRHHKFRSNILRARKGACLLTECKIIPALEAAHIIPVSMGGTDEVKNGILLRRDVHRLFDLGHINISHKTLTVTCSLDVKEEYKSQVRPQISAKDIDLRMLESRNGFLD